MNNLAELRLQYPEGTRIELIFMEDKQAPKPGSKGTVKSIDDMGQIQMTWDAGSTLSIIPTEDKFKIIYDNLEPAYEYMLHVWGGLFDQEKVIETLGIDKDTNYYWFDTAQERELFLRRLETYSVFGLARNLKEGTDTRKRTVVYIDAKYEGKIYSFSYDFGYAYPESAAHFMFEDGNYSCDCNLSRFIQDEYPEFPELDCGEKIEYEKFEVKFLD